MLVSDATGRRKVGKFSWLDNRGEVEVVDTCMKTFISLNTMFTVLECASPVPGSRMVPGWPVAEMPLSSLPQ